MPNRSSVGDGPEPPRSAAVKKVDLHIDAASIRQKPEAPFREAKQAVDLGQAERIVAVGRGIKSQENIPLAEKLAKAMGAEWSPEVTAGALALATASARPPRPTPP